MAKVERSGWERVALTMRAIGDGGNALLRCIFVYSYCYSKSFWDLPPRRRPWKAGPSQNDDFLPRFGIHPLWKAFQGTSIPKRFGTTLFRHLCGPSRPCFAASCFPDLSHQEAAGQDTPCKTLPQSPHIATCLNNHYL